MGFIDIGDTGVYGYISLMLCIELHTHSHIGGKYPKLYFCKTQLNLLSSGIRDHFGRVHSLAMRLYRL